MKQFKEKGTKLANKIQKELTKYGYYANPDIAYHIMAAISTENPMPILIEGDAGVGKTSLAKATAEMLDVPLIRVQFYEGITAEDIQNDYDYQKQLLTISAIKDNINKNISDKTTKEAIDYISNNTDFYGDEFLIKRPLLSSLTQAGRKVLLLDEIDKTNEEVEYILLEMLSEYSVSIPQFGNIKCKEEDRPIVFLTSNGYRELSDALKRRCMYLYIPHKTKEELTDILFKKVGCSDDFAKKIAECLCSLNELSLKHNVSVSEGIAFAKFLTETFGEANVGKAEMLAGVGTIAKTESDMKLIKEKIQETIKD